MDDSQTMAGASKTNLARGQTSPIGGGRLGVYATLGALTGIVPLPWIPDALARRIRGALVHDVASRHGLSLAVDARAILAEPSGPEGPRGFMKTAARFVGMKLLARVGPIGFIPPVRDALETFVLGYLFDRYLELARSERAVRIDVDEARRVRHAIDRALVHALSSEAKDERVAVAPEELRDGVTQLVDGILAATAGAPSWLVRRLDAAFDELLPHTRG